MENVKTRSQISEEDKWNIELIYTNEEEFNNDLKLFSKKLKELELIKDDFLSSLDKLKTFLQKDDDLSRILEKLAVYASCKSDEDKTNSKYQELDGKISNLFAEYSEKTSSVVPYILKFDSEKIEEYLKDESLAPYRYSFKRILSKKEHILSEEVEKVISMYQPVLSASSDTSSYLTNADLEFGKIKDENNKDIELTEANYSQFIKSKDRRVREESFKKLLTTYKGVRNTLTSTYSQKVNNDSITSRLRKFPSSIEMYLSSNKIPIELYDNLIKVVHNNLDTLYSYYDLKKKMLNLDEFHLYDGYVSVVKDIDKKYSFDDARNIVIDALSVLGKDYVDVLKTAFSDGWIDKYPNKGKVGGAYSTGSYDTLPYVLLNYTSSFDDVSTLAHELGHSMHTYFTNKSNPYQTANYPIFLAEIASTTNELILNNYMFNKAETRDEKLSILNEKLDLFKATLFRQTMFAEFEQIVHKYVDEKNVLTADYLTDIYYDLNRKYFGDKIVIDDEIRYEWLRIPHFYSPFYVYQYATSLSISCYVARNIINKTEGFIKKYLKFLASGGTDYPLEVLKIIDIDLHDTKVFESAMTDFKETLDEFRKIYENK